MSAVEPLEGLAYLDAKLFGDATLNGLVSGRIHDVAPQGTATPYVTFAFLGGADALAVGAHRVWNRGTYMVKVTGTGESYVPLEPIATRIDELLHDTGGDTDDGRVYSCVRLGIDPLSPYYVGGVQYREIIARYHMEIQAK